MAGLLRFGERGFTTCLYGLRHGGASHDTLNRLRSLQQVKERGRWVTDSSVRRYKGKPCAVGIGKAFEGSTEVGTRAQSGHRQDVQRQALPRAGDGSGLPSHDQIFASLNAKFDEELEKRGIVRKGFAGTTGMHVELFAGCGRHAKERHKLGLPCFAFDF